MIVLDVKDYCQSCEDFCPAVEKPEKLYYDFGRRYELSGDTRVYCKNYKRCEKIYSHLKGENAK